MDTTVTKSSDITIRVGLNAQNVPVKIEWGASDRNEGQLEECGAMAVALYDKEHRETLRIDLWTKEMQVSDFDRFTYQTMRTLTISYLRACQNQELAEQMQRFVQYFGEVTGVAKTIDVER